jgi:hypothetical protein
MMQLQEGVNIISEVLLQFVDQFNGWKTSVESRLPQSRNHEMMSPLGAQASTSMNQESQFVPPPQQPATPAESVRTDRSHATETSPKEQTGLQGDHTTPAHKLLDEWKQMSIFY